MPGTQMADGVEEYLLAAWDKFASTQLGPEIRDDAKRLAPVGPSTPGPPPRVGGELRDSIEDHMNGHTLEVWAHAPYAAWVELGTRPHIIQAHARTRGGWTGPYTGKPGLGQHTLRWFVGGIPVFAMRVHHPGTRPQSYLRAALYKQMSA